MNFSGEKGGSAVFPNSFSLKYSKCHGVVFGAEVLNPLTHHCLSQAVQLVHLPWTWLKLGLQGK